MEFSRIYTPCMFAFLSNAQERDLEWWCRLGRFHHTDNIESLKTGDEDFEKERVI